MIFLHLACVLASLLSFSTAAPMTDDCSQLIQHLTPNELHQILGRWIIIEGFSNNELFDSILKNMESAWVKLSTTADNKTLLLDQASRLVPQPHQTPPYGQCIIRRDGSNVGAVDWIQAENRKQQFRTDQCMRIAMNVTLVDGEALEFYIAPARSYYRFLQTCPGCLLMHSYNKENTYQMIYLLARNATLPDSDLKTFSKQAECLQFPQPAQFHYDNNKELCPE